LANGPHSATTLPLPDSNIIYATSCGNAVGLFIVQGARQFGGSDLVTVLLCNICPFRLFLQFIRGTFQQAALVFFVSAVCQLFVRQLTLEGWSKCNTGFR